MAWRSGPMKYNARNLNTLPMGEVHSLIVNGHHVRKESLVIDGTRFYRFTVDPGLTSEYTTFLSTDEKRLYSGLIKRLSR